MTSALYVTNFNICFRMSRSCRSTSTSRCKRLASASNSFVLLPTVGPASLPNSLRQPAFYFLQNADDLFFLVPCSSTCHETILLLPFYSDSLTLPGTLFGGIDHLQFRLVFVALHVSLSLFKHNNHINRTNCVFDSVETSCYFTNTHY